MQLKFDDMLYYNSRAKKMRRIEEKVKMDDKVLKLLLKYFTEGNKKMVNVPSRFVGSNFNA